MFFFCRCRPSLPCPHCLLVLRALALLSNLVLVVLLPLCVSHKKTAMTQKLNAQTEPLAPCLLAVVDHHREYCVVVATQGSCGHAVGEAVVDHHCECRVVVATQGSCVHAVQEK